MGGDRSEIMGEVSCFEDSFSDSLAMLHVATEMAARQKLHTRPFGKRK
jgi:hypothetical protein